MGCEHEIWEMDTAVGADGLCPICLSATVKKLEQRLSSPDWQDISTAPTDGTTFDGWGYYIPDSAEMPAEPEPRRHTECFWGRRDSDYVRRSRRPHMGAKGWCVEGHDGWAWAAVLTHWMPAPKGPEVTKDT